MALRVQRRARRERLLRTLVPALALACVLLAWEAVVRINDIPNYIIPAPSLVLQTLVQQWSSLWPSLMFTLKLTFSGLALAVIGGVLFAAAFALSRWVEVALFPFAVVLQVTPVVAIAPLILIYVESTFSALLICAWLVAFFPILSNTVIGLRSADHNLKDLFLLYRTTPWQRLRFLLVPSALPYFLAGLKIAGGLSLIGAVVAEFVAGTAGAETGLASRILEASFRNEIPRMFAALVLISLCGVAIFLLFNWLSRLLLSKWHDSEIRSES
ncbi:ABC transporter permease [Ramlibacter sp. AN1015]